MANYYDGSEKAEIIIRQIIEKENDYHDVSYDLADDIFAEISTKSIMFDNAWDVYLIDDLIEHIENEYKPFPNEYDISIIRKRVWKFVDYTSGKIIGMAEISDDGEGEKMMCQNALEAFVTEDMYPDFDSGEWDVYQYYWIREKDGHELGIDICDFEETKNYYMKHKVF